MKKDALPQPENSGRKTWLTNRQFRIIQGLLDKKGIMTVIIKDGKRRYSYYINGSFQKTFTSRESARRRIAKLYNKHYEKNKIPMNNIYAFHKLITLDEAVDNNIGKVGTEQRREFENDLKKDLSKWERKERLRKTSKTGA